MGDDQSQTEEPANCAARDHENAAKPNPSRAALMNVRVEAYDDPRGINGKHGRRNLSRIYQVKPVSAEVHGSSQLAEQSALRLPGDAIGESALDLKTFLQLHPRIDGGKHIPRGSGDGSRRRRESGTGDLRDESPLFGDVDAGSFLRQCLVDRGGVEPDLVSYVPELSLANEIGGIGERAGALELRRASENTLERLSVEQRLSCGKRRLLISHAELYLLNLDLLGGVVSASHPVVSHTVRVNYESGCVAPICMLLHRVFALILP